MCAHTVVGLALALSVLILIPDGVQGITGQELLDEWRGGAKVQHHQEKAPRNPNAFTDYLRRSEELDKLDRVARELRSGRWRLLGRDYESPYPHICQMPQECKEKAKEIEADVRRARKESRIQYYQEMGKLIPKDIVEEYFKAKGWE